MMRLEMSDRKDKYALIMLFTLCSLLSALYSLLSALDQSADGRDTEVSSRLGDPDLMEESL
jgi:hypothetical protein